MKNTKIKLGAVLAGVLLLSAGCGEKMPNVSDEQMNAIGEYAAIMLLKYDANNRSRLVDDAAIEAYDKRQELLESLKEPEPQEQPQKTEETQGGSGAGQGGAAEVSYDRLEDFFVMPQGMGLVYAGYTVSDSYPDGDAAEAFLAVDAAEGKKLLVLKFVADNPTGQTQTVDFFSYNATYRITVNGQETRGILTTMLTDDMSSFIGDVEAQTRRELVLVTEMDENVLAEINSIVLKVKNDSNARTIQLY